MKKSILLPLLLTCNFMAARGETQSVQDRVAIGRAVQAVVWGMPAVNTDLMLQAALKAGAKENEIVYWSRPVDWHNQTLTPNPDAIYFMPFFNTKQGPVVLEVPPAGQDGSITGNIDDLWQMPLEDAGPSGADKGAGGKYLILPPAWHGRIPAGYIVLRSPTYSGYALIRSTLRSHSDTDVAKAVAYGKRLKLYAFASTSSPTRFVDAADVLFDSTIPYDVRYFQSLDRIVQREPWLERDKVMIDQLKSIGIEKGKPFAPDANSVEKLNEGAREAHEWIEHRSERAYPPYFPNTHWVVPAASELVQDASKGYTAQNIYPVDARAIVYSMGYVGIKRLGAGQFYLMSWQDRNGDALDGGQRYRLTVPPNAPMRQYWSATAYSRATHALIKDLPRASRSSQAADMEKNPDGSVDVYFGPESPAGHEKNWVPTRTGERFELLFRLYGPTQPLFDKTWALPDLVKITAQ
ncbi:DUF1254 domain-containing protein [Paraburkholderia sartisoli]|uniref:Uncharacterized conserved protein n=1 Tax=Paraburkholderia sartisoli TaxID=83784 RepID=A0A1H4B0E9_9BURK|nr:DUF1254 domain-containing protein [Paraburkholderia sartisoli]SEA41527.1 Uncharacterized conserved protein [Paraburkholderia sartisoli]